MPKPVMRSFLAPAGLLLVALASFPVDAAFYSTDGGDGIREQPAAGEIQVADNRHRGRDDRHDRGGDRHGRNGNHWKHGHHGHGGPLIVVRPAPRVVYYRDSYVYPRHGYYDAPAARFLGAFAGAVVGGVIGSSMAHSDHVHAAYVLETGRTGYRSEWRNPDSGRDYAIVPTRTYQDFDGQYCREYTTWGRIGGREQQLYGQACRMPDGSWRISG